MENPPLSGPANGVPISSGKIQDDESPKKTKLPKNAPLVQSLFKKSQPGWFAKNMQVIADHKVLGKAPGMGLVRAALDPEKAAVGALTEGMDKTAENLIQTGIVTIPVFGKGVAVAILGGATALASKGLKTMFLEKGKDEIVGEAVSNLELAVKVLEEAKVGIFQKILRKLSKIFGKGSDEHPIARALHSVNASIDKLTNISLQLKDLYIEGRDSDEEFEKEELALKSAHDEAKEALKNDLNRAINGLIEEANDSSKNKETQTLKNLAIKAAFAGVQVEESVSSWSPVTTKMKLIKAFRKTEEFVRETAAPVLKKTMNFAKGLFSSPPSDSTQIPDEKS